jgi:hypothetical protein
VERTQFVLFRLIPPLSSLMMMMCPSFAWSPSLPLSSLVNVKRKRTLFEKLLAYVRVNGLSGEKGNGPEQETATGLEWASEYGCGGGRTGRDDICDSLSERAEDEKGSEIEGLKNEEQGACRRRDESEEGDIML